MSKTKSIPCLNDECRNAHKSAPTQHTCKGLVKCKAGEAMELLWVCDTCGHEHQTAVPKVRCHKRVWPYHNDSVGVTFESESHEQKYCKANKMTPINE